MTEIQKGPSQSEDEFMGIDPNDIEDLQQVGHEISVQSAMSAKALEKVGVIFADEIQNPTRVLTPEERREKEIAAFHANEAQQAQIAEQRLRAGRSPEIGKLTAKEKWHRFFGIRNRA